MRNQKWLLIQIATSNGCYLLLFSELNVLIKHRIVLAHLYYSERRRFSPVISCIGAISCVTSITPRYSPSLFLTAKYLI